jgi:hypothetical protein
MVDTSGEAPSAKRLMKRLALPGGGGERGGVESGGPDLDMPGIPESYERLEAARAVLKRLAQQTPDVDETVVDQMIRDAEEALRKLNDEGEDAELTESEVFGVEAVIETDGSRPVLFVQDGTIDLGAPELEDSLAARWQGAASAFLGQINTVVQAVGGVQLPAFARQRVGTAFALAPGLVITNRHVLEEIADFVAGKWKWKFDAEVDFVGEHARPGTNTFKLKEVVLTGPTPINRRVNFKNLDLAVIRVEGDESLFPKPLSFERKLDSVTVGEGRQPPVYVVGFPAQPHLASGEAANGAPPLGHEYQEVLDKLYRNRFGSKRWAPGLVEAGAGQLAGDAKKWVMSHDASTLGGNSGSCVVDFANNGERVVGLHFGGHPRVENYAHVVAALQEDLTEIKTIEWI